MVPHFPTPRAGFVALAVLSLAMPSLGTAASPAYIYFQGERVPLDLEPSQLHVHFRTPLSEPERLSRLAEQGVAVRSASDHGAGWSRVQLERPLAGLDDVEARIRALLRNPDVDFVSPVLLGPDGFGKVMLRDVVVRFRAGYQGPHRPFLSRRAPEMTVVQRRIGGMSDAYVLSTPYSSGLDVLAAANRLAEDPDVKWAEPDMLLEGTEDFLPNDPTFPLQWPLRNTGIVGTTDVDMAAEVAWEATQGLNSLGVLILDNGVQQNHPDLTQHPGMDFTGQGGGGGPVFSGDNHGTAVAGCPSATIDNGIGVTGVSPGVPAVGARNCSSVGGCSSTGSANALQWAQDNGYRITNWSWTVTGSAVVSDAYESTYEHGVVHFSSAGNSGTPTLGFPQNLSWVNAISSVDAFGNRASSSNHGPGLSYSGPGVSVPTTDRTGSDGYGPGDETTISGTSFSSPYAAGVAALALSANPDQTPAQVERNMRRTSMDYGAPGKDDDFGHGFVNANSAVRFPTRRVSLKTTGAEGTDASGGGVPDEVGRWIAFHTDASNLTAGDNNGVRDVVVHDRENARTKRLSRSTGGDNGNDVSENPTISQTGRHVGFESDATNLDALVDGNSRRDVFVRDRDVSDDGAFDEGGDVFTSRVSLTESGGEIMTGDSWDASISGDGDRIAFTSDASDVVAGDSNMATDIFLRDTTAGTTVRISVATGGGQATGASRNAAISRDGMHVAFESDAEDLIGADNNHSTDVFVRDLNASTTVRVSVATGGVEVVGASTSPAISEDGRYVTFASMSPDLVNDDGNGVSDVFLHDRDPDANGTYDEGNGTTVRVSVTSDGSEATGASTNPSISYDGQNVAFESEAGDLVRQPTGTTPAIFTHNRTNGVTMLVSKSSLNVAGSGTAPEISGDARHVAYDSDDDSLGAHDSNGFADVYLFQDNPCNPPVITTDPISQDVTLGDPVTFRVDTSGSPPLFQWRRNGVPIPGAIFQAFTIASVTPGDLGTYDVVATNHCDAATSAGAALTAGASSITSLEERGIPGGLALERPAPTPFRGSTGIRFGLPAAGPVRLSVHDVSGRRVTTLVDEVRAAGWHQVRWGGEDTSGAPVASGVYFVRLETEEGARSEKLVKLR